LPEHKFYFVASTRFALKLKRYNTHIDTHRSKGTSASFNIQLSTFNIQASHTLSIFQYLSIVQIYVSGPKMVIELPCNITCIIVRGSCERILCLTFIYMKTIQYLHFYIKSKHLKGLFDTYNYLLKNKNKNFYNDFKISMIIKF